MFMLACSFSIQTSKPFFRANLRLHHSINKRSVEQSTSMFSLPPLERYKISADFVFPPKAAGVPSKGIQELSL